jgi:hypothetical protein
LLDEESLLAAMRFASANFVARIADGRIGIERRLLCACTSGADARFRLAERGIVLPRGFQSVVKSKEFRPTRFCLSAAQARKVQGESLLTMLVLRLHAGHGRLLPGGNSRTRKKKRDEQQKEKDNSAIQNRRRIARCATTYSRNPYN